VKVNAKVRCQLIGFFTLFRKEVMRFMRVWLQTILAPLITALLYFIIFGKIIGRHVGLMGGIPYIQFIVPGMVMMQIIMASYMNVSSSLFVNKLTKSIEEILISPLSNQAILLAYMAASILRALIVGGLVLTVAFLFTHLHFKHLWIVIETILTTSALAAILGMINAIYAKKFDDINIVPLFVITPLSYLGGIFYSIQALPRFWQYLSHVNPIFYMIDTFRYSMLGISDINIHVALPVLLIITVIAYLICLYLLNKGVGLRG